MVAMHSRREHLLETAMQEELLLTVLQQRYLRSGSAELHLLN
jgi:hypothetical protein